MIGEGFSLAPHQSLCGKRCILQINSTPSLSDRASDRAEEKIGSHRKLKSRGSLARYRARWGIAFVSPLIIGMTVFVYGALIYAFYLSLTEYNAISAPKFVGLKNYLKLVDYELFWTSLKNTGVYILGFVSLCFVVSLLLALGLNQKIKGIIAFRSIFFLPVLMSMISAGLIWKWLYLPDFGVLNWILTSIGLPSIKWFLDPGWAMPALILMSVWKWAGYYAFIFLASLQGISEEYYEAATMDGANLWHKFWKITFPLISPTSFFVIVTMVISSAQVFDLVWITTKGGPSYTTFPIVQLIYRHGFELLEFGKASAIAVVLFIFIMFITVGQFRLQDRWVTYES